MQLWICSRSIFIYIRYTYSYEHQSFDLILMLESQQDYLDRSTHKFVSSNLEDTLDKKFRQHRKIIKLRGKGIVDG